MRTTLNQVLNLIVCVITFSFLVWVSGGIILIPVFLILIVVWTIFTWLEP